MFGFLQRKEFKNIVRGIKREIEKSKYIFDLHDFHSFYSHLFNYARTPEDFFIRECSKGKAIGKEIVKNLSIPLASKEFLQFLYGMRVELEDGYLRYKPSRGGIAYYSYKKGKDYLMQEVPIFHPHSGDPRGLRKISLEERVRMHSLSLKEAMSLLKTIPEHP